jgi:hypothetical protein
MLDIQSFTDSIKIHKYQADSGEMAYGIVSQETVIAYMPTGHEMMPTRTDVDGELVLLLQPGVVLFGKTKTEPSWLVHLPHDFHGQINICDVSTKQLVHVIGSLSEMGEGAPIQLLVNVPNADEHPLIPIQYYEREKQFRLEETDRISIVYYSPSAGSEGIFRQLNYTYLSPGTVIVVDNQTKLCAGVIHLTESGIPMLIGGVGEPIQQVLARFAN